MIANVNWNEVIADAAARLDWVAGQTADPADQSRLLTMAGDGRPVETIPAPATVRTERRRAITRQRMERLLGHRKESRWAGREKGAPVGTFDPAEITAEQAASLLVVVRAYVRRWAGPLNAHPLSPEGQDDTVSRIVHAIWTRDYAKSGLGRGNLAGATWQACALFRKTGWVGPEVMERRDEKRSRRRVELGDWTPVRSCDNPARIAAAVETAERGIAAPSTLAGKTRNKPRRERGRVRMPAVDAATARECLTGIAAG